MTVLDDLLMDNWNDICTHTHTYIYIIIDHRCICVRTTLQHVLIMHVIDAWRPWRAGNHDCDFTIKTGRWLL